MVKTIGDKTRKFSGKTFHYRTGTIYKHDAQGIASDLRKQGFLVRIIKNRNRGYSIYTAASKSIASKFTGGSRR